MDEKDWRYELSLFARDLFADLMSRHPLLYTLPRKHYGSPYFTSEVGKCVMLKWHEIRNEMERKLRWDFPRFVKTEDSFKQYLKLFVDIVLRSEQNTIAQVFGLSAVLLGVICFVHRRGLTHFVHDASNYLFLMLFSVKPEEFYEEGGWPLLASVSAKLIEDYDEEEICRQYLLEAVCNFSASCLTLKIKSSSNFKYSTDTSSRITEKRIQEVVSIYHEHLKESQNDSANEQEPSNEMTEKTFQSVTEISPQHEIESGDNAEQDSTLNKAETKRLSQYESPSKQEPLVTTISESAVFESKNVTGESSESNEECLAGPKLVECPQTEEENQISSECVKASQTSSKDSSFQTSLKANTSQPNLESLEKMTERKMPDGGEPSMDDLNNSTAESIRSEDFVKSENCLHESLRVEASTTVSEAEQFLTDETTTHVKMPFLTKEEAIKVREYFSRDAIESTTEISAQHKPTDEVANNVDEQKTDLKDSTGQKDCDVNGLRGEVSQMGLELINNCQEEPKRENLDNVEVISPRKLPSCIEQACDNGSAKVKSPSLFKSPKVETGKKFTPAKVKSPAFETCGVRNNKNKVSTPKNNGKVTPIKTPTTRTPNTSGRSKAETTKTSKSHSAEPISPVCLKPLTERELSKFQSQASDKIKAGRRLSLPKASPEITKSSHKTETGRRLSLSKASAEIKSVRPISASAANTKLGIKCAPAADASKPLPGAVLKSKTRSKDLPSNQLKASSSAISASAPRSKVGAKEAPVACEKNKKLQSSKSKTENVKESTSLEKSAGSSSEKSTEATESNPHKRSTESLNTRCTATKGNNPPLMSAKSANHSNTGQTLNPLAKSASVDSKTGKPRWR